MNVLVLDLTVDFDGNGIQNVIVILVMQHNIGGCKGNYALCGRNDCYFLRTEGLYCDYNISPTGSDNACMEIPLKYKFLTMKVVVGKSKDKVEVDSFLSFKTISLNYSLGVMIAMFMVVLQLKIYMLRCRGYINTLQKQ